MQIQPIISPVFIVILLVILLGFLWWKFWKNDVKLFDRILFITKTLCIAIFIFTINLRVMKPTYDTQIMLKNIDVLFVVDNTLSMYAQDDTSYTRMTQVKIDLSNIMAKFDGSNFAMIKFDNTSQILSPFTQDIRNIQDILDVLDRPDTYYAKGSSLNTPYNDMEKLLQSSYEKSERMTIAFFISDGEITDGSTLQSYQPLQEYIDGGAVLGYGTTTGGKMRIEDFYSEYLQDDATGSDAISKIDETNLNAIASDLGIEYIHMPNQDTLDSLLTKITNQSSSILGDSNAVSYEDIYYYFAWPLIGLLLIELIIFIRKGKV